MIWQNAPKCKLVCTSDFYPSTKLVIGQKFVNAKACRVMVVSMIHKVWYIYSIISYYERWPVTETRLLAGHRSMYCSHDGEMFWRYSEPTILRLQTAKKPYYDTYPQFSCSILTFTAKGMRDPMFWESLLSMLKKHNAVNMSLLTIPN